MILDAFEGSVIFTEQENPEEEQAPVDQSEPGDPPEFVHLKKYYLLERLRNLSSRLEVNNITNDDLELILQFGNEFSYDTLVRLADDITDIIKVQLSHVSREVKSNDRQKKAATI